MDTNTLKQSLEDLNITLVQIAQSAGYSQAHISRYFAGYYKGQNLRIISAALDEIERAQTERKAIEAKAKRVLECQ